MKNRRVVKFGVLLGLVFAVDIAACGAHSPSRASDGGASGASDQAGCTGTPFLCSTESNQDSCIDLVGCSWTSGICTGVALECEDINQSFCEAHGCTWKN